jgi:hypothetical protein
MYTESGSILALLLLHVREAAIQEMEDGMYPITVLLTLVLVRIVLPVGLLLLVGEFIRARRRAALKGI